MFSGEICEIFKNAYIVEHLRTVASDATESNNSENENESYNESRETVVCNCSSKYQLLKISQISQENTCARVALKQICRPCNFTEN